MLDGRIRNTELLSAIYADHRNRARLDALCANMGLSATECASRLFGTPLLRMTSAMVQSAASAAIVLLYSKDANVVAAQKIDLDAILNRSGSRKRTTNARHGTPGPASESGQHRRGTEPLDQAKQPGSDPTDTTDDATDSSSNGEPKDFGEQPDETFYFDNNSYNDWLQRAYGQAQNDKFGYWSDYRAWKYGWGAQQAAAQARQEICDELLRGVIEACEDINTATRAYTRMRFRCKQLEKDDPRCDKTDPDSEWNDAVSDIDAAKTVWEQAVAKYNSSGCPDSKNAAFDANNCNKTMSEPWGPRPGGPRN